MDALEESETVVLLMEGNSLHTVQVRPTVKVANKIHHFHFTCFEAKKMTSCQQKQQARQAGLEEILSRHPDVAGFNVGYMFDYKPAGVSAGYARVSTQEKMTPAHYMEAASLSKTVGTAFACEYFKARGVSMQAPVNTVLRQCGSPWLITLPPKAPSHLSADWPETVTLAQLVNHTALGMHYVYGLPLSHGMPQTLDFLDGTLEHAFGYAPLYLEKKPGSSFKYSGGGFITLQYLVETLEGGEKSITEIMQSFLSSCGMHEFTFTPLLPSDTPIAYGQMKKGEEVASHDGGRLAFPALAAGGLCTPTGLLHLLSHLSKAYRAFEDGDSSFSGPISPETAAFMLGDESLQDLGSVDFMRSRVGHGVFVAQAGPNKLMLHQAANEGFRGVYFVCFSGPDRGKGFVLLCNGDNPAVMAQSEAARYLLNGTEGLGITGIDFTQVKSFDMTGLKQEEIVNLGLKELVLSGFVQSNGSGSDGGGVFNSSKSKL